MQYQDTGTTKVVPYLVCTKQYLKKYAISLFPTGNVHALFNITMTVTHMLLGDCYIHVR